MPFTREEVIENQLRQAAELVSLPKEWGGKLLGRVAQWKREAASSAAEMLAGAVERLSGVESKLARLTDLVADGVISREDYTPRKEKLILKKTSLRNRIAGLERETDLGLERLELFLKEAEDARAVALSGDVRDVVAFHRKIGSNFLLAFTETVPGVRNDPSSVDGGAVDALTNRDGKVIKNPPKDFVPIRFNPNRRLVSGSVKSPRKIRLRGLPVLCVRYPRPWFFLPPWGGGHQWWSFLNQARTWFEDSGSGI